MPSSPVPDPAAARRSRPPSCAAPVVAFDLDGTLVDTAPDLTAALDHALAALGRPAVDAAMVRAWVGHGARALVMHGLGEDARDSALVEEGVALFMAHYRLHLADHSRPFPGTEAALDQLAEEGFRLAICTNKSTALSRALVEALGWTGRFAAVLGADATPHRKPDPRHLLAAIDQATPGPLFARPAAVFVGDSVTDRDTARAAGVPIVLVRHGYQPGGVDGLEADAHVDGMADCAEAVGRLLDPVQGEFKPGLTETRP